MSHVRCQMSDITFQVSHVRCHMYGFILVFFFVFFTKRWGYTVRSLDPICSSTIITLFFRALFQEEPHRQGKANKEKLLPCRSTRYKLTSPGDIIALPCINRQTGVSGGQSDIYSWLHGRHSMIFCVFVGITSCGSVSLKGKNYFWRKTQKSLFLSYMWYGKAIYFLKKGMYQPCQGF